MSLSHVILKDIFNLSYVSILDMHAVWDLLC